MKKLSYPLLAFAMILMALSSSHASSDDLDDYSGRKTPCSLLKTVVVGALLFTSPAAVMAENPGFVGCYYGQTNSPKNVGGPYTIGIPVSNSNNITINQLGITNWNSYNHDTPYRSFNANNFSIGIECDIQSYCKYFYIKAANLCQRIFDVNYFASMENKERVSSSSTAPAYYPFYLSVWKSFPSLDGSIFDGIFSSYMRTGSCPPSSDNPGA